MTNSVQIWDRNIKSLSYHYYNREWDSHKKLSYWSVSFAFSNFNAAMHCPFIASVCTMLRFASGSGCKIRIFPIIFSGEKEREHTKRSDGVIDMTVIRRSMEEHQVVGSRNVTGLSAHS